MKSRPTSKDQFSQLELKTRKMQDCINNIQKQLKNAGIRDKLVQRYRNFVALTGSNQYLNIT
ncbi:hypothetical protein PROFUN_05177 [Planoprotostelium fungivorum]|uniref:Uncharacterized protein n=1 Tax=Planoprotostelium fungivorum TaxID=1890364 RepID=A0A2P6NRE9_9EUKA|nr:hypothetical protein PROFUN_05177 [Planoprotostelium fungivorum]